MADQAQKLELRNPQPFPKSPEFGPHTPQVSTEYSATKKMSFRRLTNDIAEEVEPDAASVAIEQADPTKILANLVIPFSDPRRRKDVVTEQLVVAKPKETEKLEPIDELGFHYRFDTGVVFGARNFGIVARSPDDLAKTSKANNRAQTEVPEPSDEEEYELAIKQNEFKAIRAAIHRLDRSLGKMAIMAESTDMRREQLKKIHRYISFPTYAQYPASEAHQFWGHTDAEIHKLIDLSTLNAPRPMYGLSQLHGGMRNRLYVQRGKTKPSESFQDVQNRFGMTL